MLTALLAAAEKAHKPQEHVDKVTASFPAIVRAYDAKMDKLEQDGLTIIRYDWTRNSYIELVEKMTCAAYS
jgi:hypothetical protein